MKPASIKEIKTALGELDQKQLVVACLRLAKFKKDNKELLSYLLFENENEAAYVDSVKTMLDELFEDVNKNNVYLAKKTLRKIVRTANRFIRYSDDPTTEPEILIHVTEKLLAVGFNLNRNTTLENMYLSLMKKINKSVAAMHEDLQFDYQNRVEGLIE